jgi:hypothetical protein
MNKDDLDCLGDRRDFWNTPYNPITGNRVPHVVIVNKHGDGELKAGYNNING